MGRVARVNVCGHPGRKHRAKGLCGACYERDYTQKRPDYPARKQAEKVRRTSRNPGPSRLQGSVQNARKGGYEPLRCNPEWLTARLLAVTHCEFPGCGKSLTVRTTHVDHDHTTGVFRGLLCRHCNAVIVGTIETRTADYNEYIRRTDETK